MKQAVISILNSKATNLIEELTNVGLKVTFISRQNLSLQN